MSLPFSSYGLLRLSGKRFRFGVMHGSDGMLRWRIHGKELQWFLFRIADVVSRAGGYGDRIPLFERHPPPVEEGLAVAFDGGEDLVDLVHLLADFLTSGQRHDDQL